MIKTEYRRFLHTLDSHERMAGTRKIANIVLNNLSVLEPLGTAAGQRVKKLVELATKDFETASTAIELEQVPADEQTKHATHLTSMTVGPFRGFSKPETFDLNDRLVLIYGPNGAGKSSFCEALEYGLLDAVEEAQSKRFKDLNEYLKNIEANGFAPPDITAIDQEGQPFSIIPDEAKYRFCFVEKNRVDNFSRLAAHLPSRQNELISSLFGLDDFNEFVRNFTAEIDEKYLDIEGKKQQLLAKKKQSLSGHEETIKTNATALETVTGEENKLGARYAPDMSFAELISSLGTADAPGVIAALENELQQQLPAISGLTHASAITSEASLIKIHEELLEKQSELNSASESLSFKQLYEAINDLNHVNPGVCPACNTSLDVTVSNPFEIANLELVKLAYLSTIEDQRDQLTTQFNEALRSMHSIIRDTVNHVNDAALGPLLERFLETTDTSLDWNWWESLHRQVGDEFNGWKILLIAIERCEQLDSSTKVAEEERKSKVQRLKELRDIEKEATTLQARGRTLQDAITTAQAAINEFNEVNKALIDEAALESPTIARNKQIAIAYASFVTTLTSYNESLPGTLVANLGELVVQLYNSFNRTDAAVDLLHSIRLPLSANERIDIAFAGKPDKFYDALHVLSEGHIRCVGLAILLAKNLSENCPILIFDDPVNAIDDEHRSAIRKTLFEDNYFKNHQIILACHGEEFYKNIHQLIGSQQSKRSCSYIFQPQNGEKHIQVLSSKNPTNYVAAAQHFFASGAHRDSLMMSRRALESLCNKLWWHFTKYGGGAISVLKRNPDAPTDLRALADKLRSEFAKATFELPNREGIVQQLTIILGQSGSTPQWIYINKGTHEEDDLPEFDRETVRQIVGALIAIDAMLPNT